MAGVLGAEIRNTVSPDFRITSLGTLSAGTARLIDETNLVWTVDYADMGFEPETVFLSFDVAHVGSAAGTKSVNAANITRSPAELSGLGHIVQVNTVVKNVCLGRQMAVSVILSEAGADGKEYPRGVKHLMLPPHAETACRDVTLRCIRFSVPEVLDVNGSPASICNSRKFHARVIANYIDTDFACCETVVETV